MKYTFILTMRNVNFPANSLSFGFTLPFILTMRNVNYVGDFDINIDLSLLS